MRTLFGEAARALEFEGERTRSLAAGLDEAAAGRALWDDPEGPWTIADLLGHVAASHQAMAEALRHEATPMPGKTLADINAERRRARRDRPLGRVLDELESARRGALDALATLTDADWAGTRRTSSGREWTAGWLAWTLSTHERGHRSEIEAALGRPPSPGRVAWLNVSAGGVPKRPIFSAALSTEGLDGDAHRGKMHGGPERALCIFSQEVIDRLRAEGHPIEPGTIGENVTVAGVEWAKVGPGRRLRLGPTVVEVTRFTTPCLNITASFADGDFSRVLSTRHPGESRVYARVVETGLITVGDPVELLPDA